MKEITEIMVTTMIDLKLHEEVILNFKMEMW